MALVNYMGDAPGTMAYQRARARQPLGFTRYKKPQDAMPNMPDLEVEGLPGDGQWMYQNQLNYQTGLKSLYSQYGGEMDWVQADPKYRQLAGTQNYYAYNKQALTRNLELTKARDIALRTYGSGQQQGQYELKDVGGGNYMMKQWNQDESGKITGTTKKEYLEQRVNNPNLGYHTDGTVGLMPIDYDEGTGDMDKFNAMMNSYFSDRGINSKAWDNISKFSQDNTQSLGYGLGELHQNGGLTADNYQQVKAAVDYVRKYGLDENHEYFLRQEMFDAYHRNRSFLMPKLNDDGSYYRDANGQLVLENRKFTFDELNDPDKIQVAEEFYFASRVGDYAEKLKQKKTESKKRDEYVYQNIDPQTGQVIQDPSQFMYSNISQGAGPETDQVGVNNYTESGEYVNGKEIILKDPYKTDQYNWQNFGPYLQQFQDAFVKPDGTTTMYDLAQNGQLNLDGLWSEYTADELKRMRVVGVNNLTLMNGDEWTTDQFGNRVKKQEWVANWKVLINEDDDLVENGRLMAFDGTEGVGEIRPIISGNLSEGEDFASHLINWRLQDEVEGSYGITLPREGLEYKREWLEINLGSNMTNSMHYADLANPNASRAKGADINIVTSTGDQARQMRAIKDELGSDIGIDQQATMP